MVRRFGARLRQLREAAGLSQEDLAERAGLNRAIVGFIENGKREIGIYTVPKLAAGLGVEPGALFDTVDGA